MSVDGAGVFEEYVRTALGRVRARPADAKRRVERILVLGYGAIGDVIFFLPFLRADFCGLCF